MVKVMMAGRLLVLGRLREDNNFRLSINSADVLLYLISNNVLHYFLIDQKYLSVSLSYSIYFCKMLASAFYV